MAKATSKTTYIIQIKICAEYRDMLPGPRLVCQEPGLRPIGRSPGVPDKSSWDLGIMSRFSVQIVICFIAYIFLFFYSSMGLVGKFAGLPSCTVSSATVHCNQNEAVPQTIKAPSMPCRGAAGPCRHSLTFMPQDWWNWHIKWMKSVSMESYQYKNQVNGEFFFNTWVILLYCSLESRLVPAVLELGQVSLFWKWIRSGIWQLSHGCQTGVCRYFPGSLVLK